MLLPSLTLLACTSIQWRDGSGVDHHLGLLAYRLTRQAHGTDLRRISCGVDLRLDGEDRGLSVGLKVIDEVEPDVVTVCNGLDLGQRVMSYLQDPGSFTPREKPTWGFLHLVEDVSSKVTVREASNLGVEWSGETGASGLRIGYANTRSYVGRALEDGIVQVETYQSGQDKPEHLILWALEPDGR